MKPFYLILLLLMNFFWAAVYSAYKVIGDQLSSGEIVTLRFGLAAVFLVLLWPWFSGKAPRGRNLLLACVMGILQFVLGQRLQVYGNEVGSAGDSSVLMALEPLMTSVAAALFLREFIGPRRLIGFVLGLSGVALLNRIWRPDFHWTGLGPSLIFVSSFFCEAAYSVIGKPVIQNAGIMKTLTISLIAGTVVNLAIDGGRTLTTAKALHPTAWILLISLAVICTVLGYSIWFLVIRSCPVNVAALTVFSQAVFGVFIAAVWIRETPHWGQLAGSMAIVTGLAVGLSRQIQQNTTTSAQSIETQASGEAG